MNKKLFAFDLDGTLLTNNKKMGGLSKEFRQLIRDIKKSGHIPIIITGRAWYSSQEIYEYNEFDTVIANNNGSYIHFPKNEYFEPIIIKHKKEFISRILNNDYINAVSNNIILESIQTAYLKKVMGSFIGNIIESEGKTKYISPIIEENVEDNIMTVLLELKNEEIENVAEITSYLEEKFGDVSSVTSWVPFDNNGIIIEIAPPKGRKDYALREIANYYKIDIKDTYAFGDQINDFYMLKLAGKGIAMKNGHSIIKEIADDVTDLPNYEFGVIDYIKKHNLLKK
ncbi:MAG: HAD family phosphatase [Mycoplasmatales bacterium]|nr:HAD family phosphatase [Mycoplasmatales bacterium]